jgi:glycosyltransferase involved in cell wall biosynthesis
MKLSIVTVTYNSVSTIKDTIESVLRQTYNDIEYWIVDGRSSDGTLDIIHSYEDVFNGRLHLISEEDKGIYDAMNKGILNATGEVVGILNSDDYFTSDKVAEEIIDVFSKNNIDGVYGDVHFIHDGHPNKCVRYYSSVIFRPSLLRFGFMPAHPSFYVRRSVYEKYGSYSLDYKIASDYDLMVRLFYKNKIKTKYLKLDFVTMRIGGTSTKNIHNRLQITKEDVIACRRNGLYTNLFFISLKYLVKVFEFKL